MIEENTSFKDTSTVFPWNTLFNPVATSVLTETVPRKRGRPRKYFAPIEGTQKHRMDDKDPSIKKFLTQVEQCELERKFKNLRDSGSTIKDAVELIAFDSGLSYTQTYSALSKLI